MEIKPPPPGAEEAPGYILDVFDGSAWVTLDGRITDKWQERGVWPTAEEAHKALLGFFENEGEKNSLDSNHKKDNT